MYPIKTKKLIYATLIETLVMCGYDISDWLNPTYKNLNIQGIIDIINRLKSEHLDCDEIITIEDFI